MLNTTNNNSKTEIKTAATGIIQRSNEKSFFIKFHQNSGCAEKLLDSSPKYYGDSVSVIQLMLISDGFLLAELVKAEDGL